MSENKLVAQAVRSINTRTKRDNFVSARKVEIWTRTEFSSTSPGFVGLTLFVSGSKNGVPFEDSMSKNIEIEKLSKVRKTLDAFAEGFTQDVMQAYRPTSFKSFINDMLDNILADDQKQMDESEE